jgi:hypothetical protein
MIPSTNGLAKSSIGYLRCNVRNGGAIASGLSLTLSMEWHCAQFARTKVKPRCTPGDCCARAGWLEHNAVAPSAMIGHGAEAQRFGDMQALSFSCGQSKHKLDATNLGELPHALAKRHGISRNLIKPSTMPALLDFSLHPFQSMSEK